MQWLDDLEPELREDPRKAKVRGCLSEFHEEMRIEPALRSLRFQAMLFISWLVKTSASEKLAPAAAAWKLKNTLTRTPNFKWELFVKRGQINTSLQRVDGKSLSGIGYGQ